MANLAIQGHVMRGNEVIEILEMLGGKNNFYYDCKFKELIYTIGSKLELNVFNINSPSVKNDYIIFTLEEFIEKFPYKVGDRVRVPEYESEVRISKMYWDGNEVQYEVVTDEVEWYSAKELNKFNEPNKPKEKKINQMSLVNSDLDEVEIVLGDKFELKIREGKYYAVKKKLYYPKTYEECCEIIHSDPSFYVDTHLYSDKLESLYKLFICRAAYWKLAGEQMGLGKPWEPDWTNEKQDKYGFYNELKYTIINPAIFVFPTAEMRDAFLENFGYLIELCKELL